MTYYIIPLQNPSSALSHLRLPTRNRHTQSPLCLVCHRAGCRLKSHQAYVARNRIQGFRKHDISRLCSTSFASSYSFNPLRVAIDRICDQLDIDSDIRDLGSYGDLASSMQKLISYDIGRNTPFTDPSGCTLGEVAAEWLVASAVDEIACASVLNLWLMIEFTNTKRLDLERSSSKVTTMFLRLLQKSIEDDRTVNVGTIFAASNHLATCLIFFEQTREQQEVLMDGLEALVRARGGFERLTENSHPGLLQSLLWSDVLFASGTGCRPRFRVLAPLDMPHSLIRERNETSTLPSCYRRCCGPDLLDTAKHLRFFLLFRHQSEVRVLSKAEYQYMVALERYIHVQLLDQSARYHETGTIAECLILAMGLMRMSVLCIWEQHVMVRRMYTQRLGQALHKVNDNVWFEAGAANALLWVCWVLLAQTEATISQNAVLRSMISALKKLLGENPERWPEDWEDGFAEKFQPLLWHADYDAYVPSIAKLVDGEIKAQA